MKFESTTINDAYVIKPELIGDSRGFFARSFCKNLFTEKGIDFNVTQCNISFNKEKGTLRGLHSQAPPYEEAKIVRCTMGALFDVILDLRVNSKTYLKHFVVELTAENRRMLYVPKGVFHGFITSDENTEVFYHMSEFYHSDMALGVRWNDPAFGIEWPGEVKVISEKDSAYPDYKI